MSKANLINLIALFITLIIASNVNVEAKTVSIPDYKLTQQYLSKHKADDIYVYVQGKCVDNKGNGVITKYGSCNKYKEHRDYNYISYRKLRGLYKGKKFTTIFKMTRGATEVDDIESRIDIVGWSKPVIN